MTTPESTVPSPANTPPSPAFGRLTVRTAGVADAAGLHALAAATFALACPPGTLEASIHHFIARHLSEAAFAGYLADPAREVLLAERDGFAIGYTMLVFEEPADADVARAISVRPTVELSKCYVLQEHHGSGVAATLVGASIDASRARAAAGIWLGVNEHNAKANRFYEKCGFRVVGMKKFLVGEKWEDDFVRELVL